MTIKKFPKRGMRDVSGTPLLGKFRKGGQQVEKTNKQGKTIMVAGREQPHWRVTFSEDDYVKPHIPRLQEAMTRLYGAEPTFLPMVRLQRDNVESVWQTSNELWGKGENIMRRCDGDVCSEVRGSDGKLDRSGQSCIAPDCGCVPVGRLFIFLPDLFRETGLLGEFMVETHSMRDIEEISAAIAEAERLTAMAFGTPMLSSVTFSLTRKAGTKTSPDGIKTPDYGVRLYIADRSQQQLAQSYQLELSAGANAPAPAPVAQLPAQTTRTIELEPFLYIAGKTPERDAEVFWFKDANDNRYWCYENVIKSGDAGGLLEYNRDEKITLPASVEAVVDGKEILELNFR